MSRIRKRILWAFALTLFAILVLTWIGGSIMTAGRASEVPAAAAPARDFQLTTDDGITLAATYWPGERADAPAVLLLHGVNASRGAVAGNAAWLASLGYAVLTIDFRGHGGSTITSRSFGYAESTDAHTAFAWLKRQQRNAPVAVIGISMGGAASLIGPRGPLPADAFVLQAVYPDIRHAVRARVAQRAAWLAPVIEPLLSYQALPRFGAWPEDLSPLNAIAQVRAPVLVIGGVEDRSTPPDETRMLFDAAPGRKSLYLVDTGGHGAVAGLADDAYRSRVRAFLRETIGAP